VKKYFSIIFLILILLVCVFTTDRPMKAVKSFFVTKLSTESKQVTIIIDPGHGGRDPGKVGVNNALEKDVNLKIAFKLKKLLEDDGITVIMTREEDVGLYSETDSNKKRADLNNRVDLIESSKADLAISIHQNSFTEEYVKGAQVFYYQKSVIGKNLAEMIQNQLKETMADDNHRKAKANTSYYMLTKTECPLVIVECGYMSNFKEADLLINDDYQNKLALGISLAILDFLDKGGLEKPAV